MYNPRWKENEPLLMEEFRRGNEEAFHHIHERCILSLYNFAFSLIKDHAEAQDIASETLYKLWKKCDTFEDLFHVKSFLFKTARYACLDFLKANQRQEKFHNQLLYLEQEGEAYIKAKEAKARLYEMVLKEVENLPEKRKEVFRLAFVHEMSTADIARELNISEETVRVQKARAINALRKALGDKGLPLTVSMFVLLKQMFNL